MTMGGPEETIEIRVTDPKKDRYASQRLIAWWDQDRLADAKIMVAGAGALGNEVLKDLALLGVGHVVIVDFDTIEMSNLTRSVLFRADDSGRPKAETAAERVVALNPDVKATPFSTDIANGIGFGIFRRMDAVIGCLDNGEARWAVNRACRHTGKPWVDGALDDLGGMVKVFIPPDGPCFECGLTETDFRHLRLRTPCPGLRPDLIPQGRVPTTITGASVIAGIQVQEALKLLHGFPSQPGSGFIYDGMRCKAMNVRLTRRKSCLAHAPYEPLIESNALSAKSTVGEVLAFVQKEMGDGAYLYLDRQIVVGLVCAGCRFSEDVMGPEEDGPIDIPPCPRCGRSRYPEITHVIGNAIPNRDVSLEELGIPPLHIIAAKKGKETLYFELTGDAEAFPALHGGIGCRITNVWND